jgi:glycosyltransferase involved in cell wall biosynthesis
VIRQTIGTEEAMNRGLTWLPHGYNGDTFKPDKNGGGAVEDVAGCPQTGDDPARVTRIGVVATNQARKDWGLVAAIARGLAAVRSDIRWWIHTDQIIREWSLPALIDDFRLTNVDVTVAPMSDAELARRYRECALTIAPGAGEGFGYPIVESLACGVPVLHGDYAGGASIMRTCGRADMLIQPDTYRVEGQYNCVRPVHDPEILVECVNAMLSTTIIDTVASVEHLRWMNLAYPWRRWFREGVR